MKKKISAIEKEPLGADREEMLTRKQAIKKSGYMALSAATMMMLLNTPSQAQSSPAPAAPTNSSPGKPDRIWDN